MHFLIVDDSALFRKVLKDILTGIDPTYRVDVSSMGTLALRFLEQEKPDIIFLDQCMPEMDGLETLEKIHDKYPGLPVVMISGVNEEVANLTLQALSRGAFDFIPKPNGNSIETNTKILRGEIQKIITAFKEKVFHAKEVHSPAISKPVSPTTINKGFNLVVIGVSTGGPKALEVLIPSLKTDLGCPVLIVQHMPAKFTASLAAHLNKHSPIQVKEAIANETLLPNVVYIAPGDYHLRVTKTSHNELQASIDQSPPINSCRPSVDALFESVAKTFHKPVLSCMLTGMGRDGHDGVRALKNGNTFTIAQNQETCVVYGMPKMIIESGLANEILPLEKIGPRINELLSQ